jgi:hypothetical protein
LLSSNSYLLAEFTKEPIAQPIIMPGTKMPPGVWVPAVKIKKKYHVEAKRRVAFQF